MAAKQNSSSYDPTANVLLLVEKAAKRQDDIRKEVVLRLDELRIFESKRVDELFKLHNEYAEKLRVAESKRLDAIREVDAAALVLANKDVQATAKVLTDQVALLADNLLKQMERLFSGLSDRLVIVEKVQSESKGKSGATAPILAVVFTIIGALILYLIQLALKH